MPGKNLEDPAANSKGFFVNLDKFPAGPHIGTKTAIKKEAEKLFLTSPGVTGLGVSQDVWFPTSTTTLRSLDPVI